jgi:glycosyltransferase involved in cell wall biosynthesis
MPHSFDAPLISVLTPSYGYGRFIEDAIQSVAGQEGILVEHIVRDGASTDQTADILRANADVVSWRSQPDQGQSDALNGALREARGEWVGWLNADEFYLPGGLAALVRHGQRTGADVIYGDDVFVDADGRLIRLVPQHRPSRMILRWYGCYISTAAVVFRRKILDEDPWDVNHRVVMDWDLFLRLAGRGARFSYVPRMIGAFRAHADRITAQPRSTSAGEVAALRGRHGLPPGSARILGRVAHAALKVRGGAYARQLRARSLRGTDLRWFRREVGPEGWLALQKQVEPRLSLSSGAE